jgi:hypothetical protein
MMEKLAEERGAAKRRENLREEMAEKIDAARRKEKLTGRERSRQNSYKYSRCCQEEGGTVRGRACSCQKS